MKKNKNYYGVIMAGGVGSRFWPMSKKQLPKQFLDIFSTGKSLFAEAYERLIDIMPEENIFIVTNINYKEFIQTEIPSIKDEQILGEPLAKNTAPCVAYASYKINKINPNALITVVPSDHLILDKKSFSEKMLQGFQFIENHPESLVTLGITPTRPDTGYGYIQKNENKVTDGIFKVKTFTEKPSLEIAKHFVESKEYLWNSGMFIWSAKSIILEFQKNLPEIAKIFEDGIPFYFTKKEQEYINSSYQYCTNISIDFGIMEKSNNVYVIPSSFGWSDIGTWAALYEYSEKDDASNVISGNQVLIRNSHSCIVKTENLKLVALNGVENIIIVEKDGILMVANKNQEQEIRHLVNDVKLQLGEDFI